MSHQISDKDFGYGGFERANEATDRVERKAYPHRMLKSAYRNLIGEVPRLKAGDWTGARIFLNRISAAIEHGGWTRSEWRRLRDMEAKWTKRAEGKDIRFNTVGNKSGGLTRGQQEHVKTVYKIRGIRNGESNTNAENHGR